jgi:uncharacterized OsmC-like protein
MTTEIIGRAFQRSEQALRARPRMGRKTATSTTRLSEGLVCEVTEGRWTLTSDLSEKAGGAGTAPDPSVLARAALGSCLAMSYRLWAVRLGVPVDTVEVTIETDIDACAQFGVGEGTAGFTRVRYHVEVTSSAPWTEIERVVDAGDRACVTLDVFATATDVHRTLTIRSEGDA